MIEKEIEVIATTIQALGLIAQRSPEYKALCSECIVDLEAVNYNLREVDKFIVKAKSLLGE
jgi:hypothetical protein